MPNFYDIRKLLICFLFVDLLYSSDKTSPVKLLGLTDVDTVREREQYNHAYELYYQPDGTLEMLATDETPLFISIPVQLLYSSDNTLHGPHSECRQTASDHSPQLALVDIVCKEQYNFEYEPIYEHKVALEMLATDECSLFMNVPNDVVNMTAGPRSPNRCALFCRHIDVPSTTGVKVKDDDVIISITAIRVSLSSSQEILTDDSVSDAETIRNKSHTDLPRKLAVIDPVEIKVKMEDNDVELKMLCSRIEDTKVEDIKVDDKMDLATAMGTVMPSQLQEMNIKDLDHFKQGEKRGVKREKDEKSERDEGVVIVEEENQPDLHKMIVKVVDQVSVEEGEKSVVETQPAIRKNRVGFTHAVAYKDYDRKSPPQVTVY